MGSDPPDEPHIWGGPGVAIQNGIFGPVPPPEVRLIGGIRSHLVSSKSIVIGPFFEPSFVFRKPWLAVAGGVFSESFETFGELIPRGWSF